MNPSDVAVIAMAAVSLGIGYWNWRVQMKVADRLRIVNPPKAPAAEAVGVPAAELDGSGKASR